MNRLHGFNVTFCLTVLVGLAATSSAWAVEWRSGGKPITKAQGVLLKSVGATEALRFGDQTLGVVIECTADFVGTAGPGLLIASQVPTRVSIAP